MFSPCARPRAVVYRLSPVRRTGTGQVCSQDSEELFIDQHRNTEGRMTVRMRRRLDRGGVDLTVRNE